VVLLFLLKLSFSPGRTGGFQLLRDKYNPPYSFTADQL